MGGVIWMLADGWQREQREGEPGRRASSPWQPQMGSRRTGQGRLQVPVGASGYPGLSCTPASLLLIFTLIDLMHPSVTLRSNHDIEVTYLKMISVILILSKR